MHAEQGVLLYEAQDYFDCIDGCFADGHGGRAGGRFGGKEDKDSVGDGGRRSLAQGPVLELCRDRQPQKGREGVLPGQDEGFFRPYPYLQGHHRLRLQGISDELRQLLQEPGLLQ